MIHPASRLAHCLEASGRNRLCWLALLGALEISQAAGASRLEGRIYDYKLRDLRGLDTSVYYPFSRQTFTGLVPGLLANRLDHAGRPVWTGKAICEDKVDTTRPGENPLNAPDRWFVSRPGKNLELPFSVALAAASQDSFGFVDSFFFPLDTVRVLPGTSRDNPFYDELLGQNMANHNFGFCMELHGMVQPRAGGRLSITGDDDTWVYVDSQLVVDMGGLHLAQSQSVPLEPHSGTVGVPVSLDIFHCDRVGNESLFALSVNVPIQPAVADPPLPPLSGIDQKVSPREAIALRSRSNALSVVAPAGQAWTLELRGLDGNLHSSVAGTGAALVPWTNSGITVALLKSGRESVRGRFVAAR